MPSRRRSMQSRISQRVLSKKTVSREVVTIPKEAFYSLMMKAWNTESEIHGAQESLLIMEGGAMRGLFTAGVLDAFMEEGLYFPCSMGIMAGPLSVSSDAAACLAALPPAATPVPALEWWGLTGLASLLAGLGLWRQRRRG